MKHLEKQFEKLHVAVPGKIYKIGDYSDEVNIVKKEVLKILDELDNANVPAPCEPECSEVRHALHHGGWLHHLEMESKIDEIRKRYKS